MPGFGGGALTVSESQLTSGLIELSIYGVVSLYEKVPAPGETPADAAAKKEGTDSKDPGTAKKDTTDAKESGMDKKEPTDPKDTGTEKKDPKEKGPGGKEPMQPDAKTPKPRRPLRLRRPLAG